MSALIGIKKTPEGSCPSGAIKNRLVNDSTFDQLAVDKGDCGDIVVEIHYSSVGCAALVIICMDAGRDVCRQRGRVVIRSAFGLTVDVVVVNVDTIFDVEFGIFPGDVVVVEGAEERTLGDMGDAVDDRRSDGKQRD